MSNLTWATGLNGPTGIVISGSVLYVSNYATGVVSKINFPLINNAMATFLAFRPRSSSELLSLRKTQIQQSLNTVPSINTQDSSELTARVRKYASVMPSLPLHGNSATLVKFKASSVVQSMVAGQAYRNSASRWVPRTPFISPGCSNILPNFMQYGLLSPKAIRCQAVISNANPQVVPFNPTVELPLRKNDNKIVIEASTVNTAGCTVNQ